MEQTPENVGWAIGVLTKLGCLPGFPQDPAALRGCAEAFLRIIPHNDLVEHRKLGQVRMADWLIGVILDTAERFPTPLDMRCTFQKVFKPATELPSFPAEE